MGKKRNKNKNKKLLKNSGSEKKPGILLEQDGTKGRQVERKNDSKSSLKVSLPEKDKSSTYKKLENDNIEIKNPYVSNKHTYQKSNVIKFTPARRVSNITENLGAINECKNINSKQDATALNVPEIKPKHGKKIISNPGVNESEYNLCEDLFSYDSGSDDDCTEFYNPYDYDYDYDYPNDYDFFNGKDLLNFGTKEKIDRKGDRIKNDAEAVTSEKSMCDAHQRPASGKIKTENVSNEHVTQKSDVTKYIARNASNITNSFESKTTIGNEIDVVSNTFGARPKQNQKDIFYQGLDEYENYCIDEHSYSNYSSESEDEYEIKRKAVQKRILKEKTTKNLLSTVNEYNHTKYTFSNIYHKWLQERKKSLEKLESLQREIQDGRKKYNEVQANFKGMTAVSRRAKVSTDSMLVGFLASALTLMGDAASGLSALAQAYNTDCFQSKFKEIMDHDAEITKELYEVRSRCVTEYRGIEEVMRKFHCDTLSSTVSKISDTLEVGSYWEAMKKAYTNDDMSALKDIVGDFFNNACESQVLGKIRDSIETYVHDNPAALEGCKSTGKAVYEYANLCAPLYHRNSLRGKFDYAISGYLMLEDEQEAERLKSDSVEYYSKVESQIEDAIDLLESEMKEITSNYDQFENQISWY